MSSLAFSATVHGSTKFLLRAGWARQVLQRTSAEDLVAPLRFFYLSYGRGLHQREIQYSYQSLRVVCRGRSVPPAMVLTDEPAAFTQSGLEIIEVSHDQWKEWGGAYDFSHRRKICAFQKVAALFDGPLVLLDGDTWFRRSPQPLSERIAPGKAVMHICEGRVNEIRTQLFRTLHQTLRSFTQQQFRVTEQVCMWNAGVIGLHSADCRILSRVLELTDSLLGHARLHVMEQLAFSILLQRHLQLSEAADVIFHYWPPYLHEPFKSLLPTIEAQAANLPEEARSEFLYRHRPRPNWLRRSRLLLRKLLEFAGLFGGYCRTNDW